MADTGTVDIDCPICTERVTLPITATTVENTQPSTRRYRVSLSVNTADLEMHLSLHGDLTVDQVTRLAPPSSLGELP